MQQIPDYHLQWQSLCYSNLEPPPIMKNHQLSPLEFFDSFEKFPSFHKLF